MKASAIAKRTAAVNSRLKAGTKSKFILAPKSLRKTMPERAGPVLDLENDVARNVGDFCRVFPFNDESYRLATALRKRFSMKAILAEIKQYQSNFKPAAEEVGLGSLEAFRCLRVCVFSIVQGVSLCPHRSSVGDTLRLCIVFRLGLIHAMHLTDICLCLQPMDPRDC